eukprot:COSAG02_NODE_6214_length_3720_cov_1.825186_2_plen_416_part_00
MAQSWPLRLVLPLLVAAASVLSQQQALLYPPFPLLEQPQLFSVVISGTAAEPTAKLLEGKATGAAAWGSFTNRMFTAGTGLLDIHTEASATGATQSFAAGFLEGALTSKLIWQYFRNQWPLEPWPNTTLPYAPPREANFVVEHLEWLRRNVAAPPPGEAKYWMQVGFLLDQLDGITAGVNSVPASSAIDHPREKLTAAQMLLVTLIDGDMDDIVTALRHQSHEPASVQRRHRTHCSALVQLSPDGDDLWLAHANWDTYQSMLRVVKYLDMPLPNAAARSMSFDSYPGALSSMTDFYRTSAGLTVTETTLDQDNPKLWQVKKRHFRCFEWPCVMTNTPWTEIRKTDNFRWRTACEAAERAGVDAGNARQPHEHHRRRVDGHQQQVQQRHEQQSVDCAGLQALHSWPAATARYPVDQ